jgi:uncharacterized protein YqjF (DUF2071 family)
MSFLNEIIRDTAHRPFEIPEGEWFYYQEWNRALFLHWHVPVEYIRPLVPSDLNIDTFEGKCYVSLVAFTMEKIRPAFLPAISCISDFEEINIRTYVENDNKKGVYFLNIEAGKTISAFIAKIISGLPYEKSNIRRTENLITSVNEKKGYSLHVEYDIVQTLVKGSELDKWLTEKYCLYREKGNERYRYDIHHKEWELKNVRIKNTELQYRIGNFNMFEKPPNLTHYSDGVKVLAWKRVKI